jgi:O-antigen/teichoic acid export membrane protein
VAPPEGQVPSVEAARGRDVAVAVRNGLKMGSSLIVTWSVALIVKMQVPAKLGPIRQGHFGFAESFATMFFATLTLGVDTYIAREVAVRPKHASDVVGGVFALRMAMSVVLFVAMGVTLWVTGRSPEIQLTALIFGIIAVLTTTNGTLGVVLNTTSDVGAAAAANVTGKIIWGVGLLVGLHYNVSLPVLALPGIVAELLRISVMTWATRRVADLRYRINVAAVKEALIESIPFYVSSMALGVLGSLGMSVLEYVHQDEREVGWFGAVQNIAYLCVLLMPLFGWVLMPLLARSYARSEAEGLAMFRRCLEALVVAIVPITVLVSAGADVLIHVAFGEKYAPAATGLSILSLVFVMTYMDTMLALVLVILRRSWSVTIISISAVFIQALLMLFFVPIGRRLIGPGGECAGAAAAMIGSEACVLVAMLTRFKPFPLDARNIKVLSKSIAVGAFVMILDRQLRFLGALRLGVDALAYVAVALAVGVVRIREVGAAFRFVRPGGGAQQPAATIPPAPG